MMGISALLDFFEEPPEAGIVSDSFAAMGVVWFRVGTAARVGRLALEVHDFFQYGVGNGYNAGVGLKSALGDNEVGKLLGEVDI